MSLPAARPTLTRSPSKGTRSAPAGRHTSRNAVITPPFARNGSPPGPSTTPSLPLVSLLPLWEFHDRGGDTVESSRTGDARHRSGGPCTRIAGRVPQAMAGGGVKCVRLTAQQATEQRGHRLG